MFAKKIIIVGCYGFKNTGDEVILASLVSSLKKLSPDMEITVFSGDPEYTQAVHKVDSVTRIVKFPCIFKDFFKRITSIKNCNLLIIGGGGLYNDTWHIVPYGSLEILTAKIFRKKIVICGVDVGPYKYRISQVLAKFFLNAADLVTVRSKGSIEELKKLGVNGIEVADLALLIERGNKKRAQELIESSDIPSENLVGISLRQLEKIGKVLNIVSIAKTLDKFVELTDKNLLFIPFQFTADISVSREIINLMKNKRKIYLWDRESDFMEINDIISKLDFMVGMRLHSIVLASINEVPFLAISYYPKVKNFCEMFTEVLPYVELQHIENSDNFCSALLKSYRNRKKYKEIISSNLEILREKATTNIEVIRKILEE